MTNFTLDASENSFTLDESGNSFQIEVEGETMSTFKMKRNDTYRELSGTCLDPSGSAVDLTGATVRFHMLNDDDETVVDAAATLVVAANGTVKYTWAADDTDVAGGFRGEFEVTYSGGAIETFPNTSYIPIRIYEDLL